LLPDAIAVLRDLGLDDAFWPAHSTPIHSVHHCRAPPPAVASTTPAKRCNAFTWDLELDINHAPLGPHVHALAAAAPYKSLQLEKVLGKGAVIRKTCRRALLTALLKLVSRDKILFDCLVVSCKEQARLAQVTFARHGSTASISVPVAVGADGVYSVCRREVEARSEADTTASQRPCSPTPCSDAHEMCYRGTFSIDPQQQQQLPHPFLRSQIADLLVKDDFQKPRSLTIFHEERTARQFGFGYLNETGTVGYWWVREPFEGSPSEVKSLQRVRSGSSPPSSWPEPIRSMCI
ncbi:hypothetical protein BC828DRAFT_410212, partial [Blastocladiella britannica]